jgi:ATP-binding cassette subfamily B protein
MEMMRNNAAKAAGVHENIMGFDKQYQTRLANADYPKRRTKQRVSIARALIKSPKVIVLTTV